MALNDPVFGGDSPKKSQKTQQSGLNDPVFGGEGSDSDLPNLPNPPQDETGLGDTLIEDPARALGAGVSGGLAGTFEFAEETVGVGEGGRDFFKDIEQSMIEGISEEGREALNTPLFETDEEGDLTFNEDAGGREVALKGFQTIGSLIDSLALGGPLAAVGRKAAKKATLSIAKRLGNNAAKLSKTKGLSLDESLDVVSNAARRRAEAVGTVSGFGLAESSIAAGQASLDAKEQARNTRLQKLLDSPKFREKLAEQPQHLSTEAKARQAQEELAQEAGDKALTRTTGPTFLFGAGAGRFYDKLLRTGLSGSRGVNALKGAGVEALQETPQSASEEYATQSALRDTVDPSIDPAEGVLPAAAEGGVLGAIAGGGPAAVLTRTSQGEQQAREEVESGQISEPNEEADPVQEATRIQSIEERGALPELQGQATATPIGQEGQLGANQEGVDLGVPDLGQTDQTPLESAEETIDQRRSELSQDELEGKSVQELREIAPDFGVSTTDQGGRTKKKRTLVSELASIGSGVGEEADTTPDTELADTQIQLNMGRFGKKTVDFPDAESMNAFSVGDDIVQGRQRAVKETTRGVLEQIGDRVDTSQVKPGDVRNYAKVVREAARNDQEVPSVQDYLGEVAQRRGEEVQTQRDQFKRSPLDVAAERNTRANSFDEIESLEGEDLRSSFLGSFDQRSARARPEDFTEDQQRRLVRERAASDAGFQFETQGRPPAGGTTSQFRQLRAALQDGDTVPADAVAPFPELQEQFPDQIEGSVEQARGLPESEINRDFLEGLSDRALNGVAESQGVDPTPQGEQRAREDIIREVVGDEPRAESEVPAQEQPEEEIPEGPYTRAQLANLRPSTLKRIAERMGAPTRENGEPLRKLGLVNGILEQQENPTREPAPETEDTTEEPPVDANGEPISVGDDVIKPDLGEGTVERITSEPNGSKALIVDDGVKTSKVSPNEVTRVDETTEGVEDVPEDTTLEQEEETPVPEEEATESGEPAQETDRPSDYGENNTLVTKDRAEELRAQLKAKLNQTNAGFDPEILSLGTQLAVYHIEAGAREFGKWANRMIEDLGEGARPFLKSWYNGARDFPGLDNEGMTPAQTIEEQGVDALIEQAQEAEDGGTEQGVDSDRAGADGSGGGDAGGSATSEREASGESDGADGSPGAEGGGGSGQAGQGEGGRASSGESSGVGASDSAGERGDGTSSDVSTGSSEQSGQSGLGEQSGEGGQESPTAASGREAAPESGGVSDRADRQRVADAENEFQAPYEAQSAGPNQDVLTPTNMQEPIQRALRELEENVGDLDAYVRTKLGYSTNQEMHEALMGLQVDGVALSINEIEKGGGLVIADQTGVGKGRQAAALIRYAIQNGKTPVFMTEKTDLFSDMWRDIEDIGGADAKPFLVNPGVEVNDNNNEQVLKSSADSKKKSDLRKIAESGQLPDDRNAVFATYSQIQSANIQRGALAELAPNAVFILDESHNASGSSNTGAFMRTLLGLTDNGVVYMSATFAKRPDNMVVYYKTDIGKATDGPTGLVDAMQTGGVPLQTIVSRQLAETGQLIRRERSFDGITIETKINKESGEKDRENSDIITNAMRGIIEADREFVETDFPNIRANIIHEAQAEGANEEDVKVNHPKFSDNAHQVVAQMLLGIKADQVAEEAISALERGEKPVIGVGSTMETALSDFAATSGINFGEEMGDVSFKDVLRRSLRNIRRIKVSRDPSQSPAPEYVSFEQLSEGTQQAIRNAEQAIENSDSGVPMSPLDWIRYRIEEAGYSIGEITGRGSRVDYGEDAGNGPVYTRIDREETSKEANKAAFNNGDVDAVLLNSSGTTGISLHASTKFQDQRQRHMIVGEPPLDINTFVQMLGRVHRTGQVSNPLYTIVNSDLPAEKRPMANLNRKMRSLNANTTSNDESTTSVDSPDLLNKYGDQVVARFLQENPEFQTVVGLPVQPDADTTKHSNFSGYAATATGRIALADVETQQAFYDEIESSYNELIQFLNSTNQNDLVQQTLDLEAELQSEELLAEGLDKTNVFGQDAFLGRYKVKSQVNIATFEEVQQAWQEEVGGQSPEDYASSVFAQKEANETAFFSKLQEDVNRAQESVDNADTDAKQASAIEARDNAQSRLDRARDLKQTNRRLMQEFRPGEGVELDFNGEKVGGVVVALKDQSRNLATQNPYALSKTQAQIMLTGVNRSMSLPLSQLSGQNSIVERTGLPERVIQRKFENAERTSTETRYIATGNLISALDRVSKGQVVTFTTSDGGTEQGILMPRTFDVQKDVDRDTSVQSAEVAFNALTQNQSDEEISKFGLATRNGEIRVLPDSSNSVAIQSAKKTEARRFFNDERFREIAGEPTEGNVLRVTLEGDQAKQAINRIIEISGALRTSTDRIARIVQPYIEEQRGSEQAQFSRSEPSGEGLTAKGVEQVVSPYRQIPGVPATRVNQSVQDLPQHLRSEVDNSMVSESVEGLMDPSTQTIHLIADNIRSQERVVEVMEHELVGHFGLRARYGGKLNTILNQVFVRHRSRVDQIAKERGFDLRKPEERKQAAEELLAQMAEQQESVSLLDKAIRVVREAIRKVKPSLQLSDAEIRSIIGNARRYVAQGNLGMVSGATQFSAVTQARREWTRAEAEGQGYPQKLARVAHSGLNSVEGFLQKNFTTTGNLPTEMFNSRVRNNGWFRRQEKHAKNIVTELKKGIEKEYGSIDKMPGNALQSINNALQGLMDVESLPEPIQAPVQRMRDNIDELSSMLKQQGVVEGNLAGVIEDNMGFYLHRTYEVFRDPDWADKVSQDVVNNAKALIREQYEGIIAEEWWEQQQENRVQEGDITPKNSDAYTTRQKALAAAKNRNDVNEDRVRPIRVDDVGGFVLRSYDEKRVRDELNTPGSEANQYFENRVAGKDGRGGIIGQLLDPEKADSQASFIANSKLGAKDLSALKQRKDIPNEIRQLWGEQKDPFVNYTRTVENQAQLISNHKMLREVREQGLGRWFFEKPQGEFKSRIAASDKLWPLTMNENGEQADLYTTPEVKQALEDAVGQQEQLAGFYEAWVRVNSITRMSKTVLSPMTQMRNVFGSGGFAVANGHVQVSNAPKSFQTVKADLKNMGDEEIIAFRDKLIELGVMNEGVRAGTLRDLARDTEALNPSEFAQFEAQTRAQRALNRGVNEAINYYQAGDDLWKVFGFLNEKARYQKAKPQWTEDQLDRHVARIVRDTYPTYSLVPEAIRRLRRFPVVGTFVSFQSEVWRIGHNLLHPTKGIIAEELADPDLKHIGRQRLMGVATAATMTTAASTASMMMLGLSDEDDENFRNFLPFWSENSDIIYLNKAEDGRISYVDASYTDPWVVLKKPAYAFMRGEDVEQALLDSFQEAARPFLGEEIFTEHVLDIMRNKTKTGGRVYNPQASFADQSIDVGNHLFNAVQPGALRSLRRIERGLSGEVTSYGEAYDPKLEAMATFLGQRIQSVNLSSALRFNALEYDRKRREATRLLTEVTSSLNTVSEESIRSAYQQMNETKKDLFEDMYGSVKAARALGLTRKEVISSLNSARISDKDIRKLLLGRYTAYTPSGNFLQPDLKRALTTGIPGKTKAEVVKDFRRRFEVVAEEARKRRDEFAR